MHEAIAQSQGVVALVSSELPSQWVAEELALAQRLDKPLLLLTLPGMTRIMGLDMGRSMRLVAHDDLTAVQAALAQFLKA